MGGILVCLMESKKSWQPRLKNIGKQGSPMDLHNWTFLTIPWTLLPLTRLSTQQAPGSVPLSSNSWEKEPHWMAWVRCSPRIQAAMAWGWCQREQIWLPGLTCRTRGPLRRSPFFWRYGSSVEASWCSLFPVTVLHWLWPTSSDLFSICPTADLMVNSLSV